MKPPAPQTSARLIRCSGFTPDTLPTAALHAGSLIFAFCKQMREFLEGLPASFGVLHLNAKIGGYTLGAEA